MTDISDSARSAPRVLLVEDSLITAARIEDHLHEALPGASVDHVTNLASALDRLSEPWDVVLTDLGLPDSEGLDTLQRMREAAVDVPIVVLTANDDTELALEAVEEHAQDFLVKRSIDPDLLGRAIRYAIGRQSIYARLEATAAEARRNEENLYQLISRSADGILVLDASMRVLYANEAACPLLGRSITQLVGEPADELPTSVDHAEIRVTRAKPERVIDVRMVNVDWQGRPAKMALLRDITERRNAEELRLQLERSERLASIGQLAAGVAHEINNPLAYVISNLELVLRDIDRMGSRGVDASTLSPRLKQALEGSLRVASIVRDLGTFAREDTDDPPAATDVNAALGGALTMAAMQLKHRATVQLELGEVPPASANAGRLAQVFLNLLVNAAHSMSEGGREQNRLTARTRCEHKQVIVELEDTGCGIAQESLERVFEPFYTTKKVGEGSGLGLYICRNILRNFGASIEIESTEGKGTLVRMALPVWAPGLPQAATGPSPRAEDAARVAGRSG